MATIVSVKDVTKTYQSGFQALKNVSLDIQQGEIIALLGPNGAGKTSLISTICGILQPTSGSITVGGFDVVTQYRGARQLIGLVPQEIAIEPFMKVGDAVAFTRGLFGKAPDPAYLEGLLRELSLWEKRDARIAQLSGGMKRRVLIAKALSHQPRILFLDEPSAGVDVELRRDMWKSVAALKKQGVTIILTTHYIEEAEEIADRVAVINHGEILLVQDKATLMSQMGKKHLRIEVQQTVTELPSSLAPYNLTLDPTDGTLVYSYDRDAERTGITALLRDLAASGLILKDLSTQQSSLEEIFVDLVKE
ncbi:MAG: ABC-2 type transport system ATP-binding protein [Paracoccaceae bacterium]|jgi:ABC-2 type transport system ATP-binding protein